MVLRRGMRRFAVRAFWKASKDSHKVVALASLSQRSSNDLTLNAAHRGGLHMRYEVRRNGRSLGAFDRQEVALARVRGMLKSDPDCEPEVLAAHTGRAFEPAASMNWRDQLAAKIGY